MTLILLRLLLRLGLCLAVACTASGLTVADLHSQLAKGDKLTVIDVRGAESFTHGHIPGALNIPAALCAQKNLPPLGKIVIYGEGLGQDATDTAAVALARKPGITVDILEGGFAAWESAHLPTTHRQGMEGEALCYITYAELKAAKMDDLVLVDLRNPPVAASQAATGAAATRTQPLTDLSREFPGVRLTKSAFNPVSSRQSLGGRSGTPPLIVLIDNGDGKAEAMARTLKANGIKRYAILAGGELILVRHGQAGLQRSGSGFGLRAQPISGGITNAVTK